MYAFPEFKWASSSWIVVTITEFPDIATCSLNLSSELVPVAFGLSSVCNRAAVLISKMYALPDSVPPSSLQALSLRSVTPWTFSLAMGSVTPTSVQSLTKGSVTPLQALSVRSVTPTSLQALSLNL